jgi:ankyrin repeat protein
MKHGFFPLYWRSYGVNLRWKNCRYSVINEFTDILLKYYPDLTNITDTKNNTLLMNYSNKVATDTSKRYISQLLRCPTSRDTINWKNDDGWTAIIYATLMGKVCKNASIVRMLLDADADPDAKNNYGGCATFYSCIYNDYPDILEKIYEKGGDLNIRCMSGWTPLIGALYSYKEHRGTAIIDLFVRYKKDVDINLQCKEGWTALMYAIEYTDMDIIEKILSFCPDLSLKNGEGKTALDMNREIVRRKIRNIGFNHSFLDD